MDELRRDSALSSKLKLGASPPTPATPASPNDGSKSLESLVGGGAVREHVEDLGIDDHNVRSFCIAGRRRTADGPKEVVLWPKRVTLGCSVTASARSVPGYLATG